VKRHVLVFTLLVAVTACSDSGSAPQLPAPPVAVSSVLLGELTERIEATGQLVAPDRAKVAAEVSGRVTEVVIDEGEPAQAGDAMLRIDPERRELELASAQARLAESRIALAEERREYKRVTRLFKENVAARSRLDQARMKLDMAQARLDGAGAQLGVAERALADANVTAPFSGIVAERFVSPGEFVQTGQRLLELVALDPIEVEFRVSERDSSRVRLGQAVNVHVAPYPEALFTATVTVISPTIDERTRTLRVKGLIDNSDGRLRPGLFARADLGVSRRENVRWIPEEAVLQRSDGAVVFRLDEEGRVERRVIATGMLAGGNVEVIEGLAEEDVVVVRGHAALMDGAAVSVRNFDGTPVNRPIASGPDGEHP